MQHEYETKVLDINVEEIEEKLQKAGATITQEEILMKRRIFIIQPHDNDGKGKRYRLRQIGEKTTLTYKERGGNSIGATKELNVEVDDFDSMAELLQKIERKTMAYQENKRKVYMLNDIEFCIDSRPKIPHYIEIEGANKEKVKEGLEILGLIGKDEGDIGVLETYQKYGIDVNSYPILKFE